MTELEIKLEQLIDSSTLCNTMEALVSICEGKAEHLRVNWQDEHDAKVWEAAAKALDRVLNVAAIRSL